MKGLIYSSTNLNKARKDKFGSANSRYKDQLLKTYWEGIEASYFGSIRQQDIMKLDWILFNVLADKNPSASLFYADPSSFLAMIRFYEHLTSFHKVPGGVEAEDKFWRNFLRHYYLCIKCYLPLLK